MRTFTGGIVYDKAEHTVQKNKFDDWSDFKQQQALGGWMAMAQQYFVAAWIPNQDKQQKFSTSVNNKVYKITNANQQISIAAGSSVVLDVNQLYLGPKEYGKIEEVPWFFDPSFACHRHKFL
jgi:YidC/Oxa1 family membrane protein insertase